MNKLGVGMVITAGAVVMVVRRKGSTTLHKFL